MDRQIFIEEQLLRKNIRKAIKIIMEKNNKKQKEELSEEQELRLVVRKLIQEAAKIEASPHHSTGINVLEDLLKKIIPVVEVDYKQLTTEPGQRASFRAHIVNAVQNALAPESAIAQAGGPEEELPPEGLTEVVGRVAQPDDLEFALDREGLTRLVIKRSVKPHDTFVIVKNKDGTYNVWMDPDELRLIHKGYSREEVLGLSGRLNHKWWEIFNDAPMKQTQRKTDAERAKESGDRRSAEPRRSELREAEFDVGNEFAERPEDNEAFIDIEDKPEEPVEADPRDTFGLDGEEVTGRNFAFSTFQKIENQIIDSYSLLDNGEDRNLFFDYLVTNLKLYFDKFEDELRAQIEEPTTPEYEREKQQQLGPEI